MTEPPTTTIPLVVTAERNERGRTERRTFHAFGGTCFDLTDEGPSPFPTTDLLNEILRSTRLRDARPGPPTRASLSAHELEAITSGTDVASDALLGAIVEIIRSEPIGNRVMCLHSSGKRTAGGEVKWLDGGERGVVLIEPTDEDSSGFEVKGVSPAEIGRLILSYLPQGPPAARSETRPRTRGSRSASLPD